jgi:hypothetical protein
MEQDSEIVNTGAEIRCFLPVQGLRPGGRVYRPNCHDSVTVFPLAFDEGFPLLSAYPSRARSSRQN